MKNFKHLMLVVIIGLLLSLTSCSRDDGVGGLGSAVSGIIVAKVDDASFQSLAISSSTTRINSRQNLIVIVTNSPREAFFITI